MNALARAEWLERRKQGLGASDAPIVAGVSPYRSPFELWQTKMGLAPEQAETPQMTRGNRLEPVAADWYAEVTGRKVRRVNQTVTDRRWPHLFAHPDRRSGKRNVQIKTGYRRWEEPPQHVVVQVQHEMGLMRTEVTDVVLMTFDDLHVYEVPRDDLLIRELFELEEAWFVKHVIGGVPPIDSSRAASRYLDAVMGEPEVRATSEQERLLGSLRDVRERLEVLERDKAEYENALKESMHGALVLVAPGIGRVSWKPHERSITDHKLLAQVYRDALAALGTADAELDTIAGLYTHTETVRPFRPTFEGEKA